MKYDSIGTYFMHVITLKLQLLQKLLFYIILMARPTSDVSQHLQKILTFIALYGY